eukprot:1820460-Rhodomonas_salina.4
MFGAEEALPLPGVAAELIRVLASPTLHAGKSAICFALRLLGLASSLPLFLSSSLPLFLSFFNSRASALRAL